jgi:EmrB/QacA subfamily drug resistance transporter
MSKKSLALLATIIGSGVAFLDGTIVNLALPAIQRDLNTTLAGLQWIVAGYSLALGALMLLGGSLGDIFGRKKCYTLGLVGFGIASLLCGLSPNIHFLISFRVLQGIFAALLIPGGLAIINTNFAKDERGKAIGTWAAWSGAFTVIGPLVGGYLIDSISWRWIFFINIPLIIVCLLLASAGVVESRDERPRRVDITGAALAGLALIGITYGLIEGRHNHWHLQTVLPLISGIALLIAFIWNEKKSRDPMVELSLFRSRNFSGSNLMTFAMYGALSGFMFGLVIYLQTKMGYSSIKAGISLLPVTIMLMLFSGKVGSVFPKYGPKIFMTIGPILVALAIIPLLYFSPGDSYLWFLLPCIFLFGAGLVLLVAPLTTTVMTSVDDKYSGIASGINNAVSRIAGLLVVASLGLLGEGNLFRFSIILCFSLALISGITSFLLIQNPSKRA